MIDNYGQTMDLIEEMKAHLPIPARPTKSFIHSMWQNGIKVTSNQTLQIEDVLYLGDEGGIGCAIMLPGGKGTVTITSLTHIRFKANHPLAEEIRAYQIERTRKLAQIDKDSKPTRFTIKPRRKSKKR